MSIDLPMPVLPPASYVPTLPPAERRRRVVLAASPCADPLELIGPMTVFQVANLVLANSDRPELGYDLEIVSSDVGDIFALPGLRITTDRPYHRLRGKVDTLVFPPMDFAVLFAGQDRFLGWVETQSRKVRRVVSVCAGAYILAAAGVLDGRRASTHWDLAHDFRRRFPEVHLDAEPIYSKDGHVYTSAGMTAGLDLAVALVEEDFGRAVALRTAQALVFFLKRPGSQAQFSTQLEHGLAARADLAELQSYIYAHVGDDLRIERLAERVNMSPRNFSRTFAREVGIPPGRYVERCRLEIARCRLEETRLPIATIAERCGFGTVAGMGAAFERHLGLSPRAYRQRFATSLRSPPRATLGSRGQII